MKSLLLSNSSYGFEYKTENKDTVFCWNQSFDFTNYSTVRLRSLIITPILELKDSDIIFITILSNLVERSSLNPERELGVVPLRKSTTYLNLNKGSFLHFYVFY